MSFLLFSFFLFFSFPLYSAQIGPQTAIIYSLLFCSFLFFSFAFSILIGSDLRLQFFFASLLRRGRKLFRKSSSIDREPRWYSFSCVFDMFSLFSSSLFPFFFSFPFRSDWNGFLAFETLKRGRNWREFQRERIDRERVPLVGTSRVADLRPTRPTRPTRSTRPVRCMATSRLADW